MPGGSLCSRASAPRIPSTVLVTRDVGGHKTAVSIFTADRNSECSGPLLAKRTFVAKLTLAEPPRPRKSQLSFNHIGNARTQNFFEEAVLARFRCASIFFITSSNNRTTPSSNAIQKLNWRSKWNCLEIGARAGRAQLILVGYSVRADLFCELSGRYKLA